MRQDKNEIIAKALRDCFISPNVSDSNWEAANLVDTMDRCASNLARIAAAVSQHEDHGPTLAMAVVKLGESLSSGLHAVADALNQQFRNLSNETK